MFLLVDILQKSESCSTKVIEQTYTGRLNLKGTPSGTEDENTG